MFIMTNLVVDKLVNVIRLNQESVSQYSLIIDVIDIMKMVERENVPGKEKKELVLEVLVRLIEILPDETAEQCEIKEQMNELCKTVIPTMIDVIIAVANHDVDLSALGHVVSKCCNIC